jgi:hypothetical protein
MRTDSWIRGAFFFPACLLILQAGCEYKAPSSPWEESRNKAKILPVITRMEPADGGSASEIALVGENFSPVLSENKAYFGITEAVVTNASPTRITVLRPNVVGDSLTVHVTVAGAAGIGLFRPYRLPAVVWNFGFFAGIDAILAAAVDETENVFLAMGDKNFIRLNPDGSAGPASLVTTLSDLWTDLSVGPDRMLYAVRSNNIVYRLPVSGGDVGAYVTFSNRNDRVKSLDLDAAGNLYAGGKNSDLIAIRSGGLPVKAGFYADYEIQSVRVANGFVYVAADYLGTRTDVSKIGIWRHALADDGSVGSQERMLDWSTGPIPVAAVRSIAISESGTIYLGTNDPENAIVMFNPATGGFKTLFFGLIPSPVDQLSWGNSTFLYAVIDRKVTFADGGKLLKIDAGEPGAR